jgi:hypothetical protein
MSTYTFNTELLNAWVEMCNKEGRMKSGEEPSTEEELAALQQLIGATLAVIVQTSTVIQDVDEDPIPLIAKG